MYTGVTDMRKGFDGLYGMIQMIMECNPLSGDVFMFYNRRHNQIRMMVYDRGGLVILSKRLSKGTFEIIRQESASKKISLSYTHLMCIMEGIKLKSLRYRKRHTMLKTKVEEIIE